MTFLEAALEVLRREGRPLHYKELTERALGKKLLTFVGRTPEVTMQTQLTAAVKKAPGNPFVRVKPGIFGLLRYPELTAEEREELARAERPASVPSAESANGAAAAADGGRRRRRRRGRGRGEGEAATPAERPGAGAAAEAHPDASDESDDDEPAHSGMSAEARAAALAETGVLEAEDDAGAGEEDDDEAEPSRAHRAPAGQGAGAAARSEDRSMMEDDEIAAPELAVGGTDDDDDRLAPLAGIPSDDSEEELGDDDEGGEGDEGPAIAGEARPAGPGLAAGEEGPGGGRRRRRRRRRGRGGEGGEGFPEGPRSGDAAVGLAPSAGSAADVGEGGAGGEVGASSGEGSSSIPPSGSLEGQGPRRIMTPVDAALEILRGQAPGRGVHVRQIADAAARRRLVHGEPNEAWRVIRTALAAEPRERLRAGVRPRVRSAGAGLYALARRPPDQDLERAEQVFGEARRALRERTLAALERRIAELPAPAFEALGRVLLQREGFGPATFVKRVEGTIYVEAMRGRGSRPSKCLIGLRFGPTTAGRRTIGELRAGIQHRSQDEGLLMLAGRLSEEAVAAWKQAGPPVEIADGPALAETCVRHGLGVINAMVSVDFVDADFFADIAEG